MSCPACAQVIYFTDVLDEYMMQHLLEFDDKKFSNVSKDNLKLGDKDDEEKKEYKVGARGAGAGCRRCGGPQHGCRQLIHLP
jgi:hypothetical protein